MVVTCDNCGCFFEKRTGEVNRAKKQKKRIFCSKPCYHEARRKDYTGKKECGFCKNIFEIKKFRPIKKDNRTIAYFICRKCESGYNKVHIDKANRRATERKRYMNQAKRERKNQLQKEWRKNNIIKNRNYHKKNIKKNVMELSNLYVVRTIYRKRGGRQIPEELIEAKRQLLKLKREIKNRKHG